MTKKILIIFGTRPEAIKLAPLIKELKSRSGIEVNVCVTGQHREMLDQVLHIFDIYPDVDLDIMSKGQDLYDITSKVVLKIKPVLKTRQPDCVLVHGDTTTAFSATLGAFYERIRVGHVEAGMRTYDLDMPWPEEANRQLIDRLSTFHFAPTEVNQKNLIHEKVPPAHLEITGNTVVDALLWVVDKIQGSPDLESKSREELIHLGYSSLTMNNSSNEPRIVLITGHRRENFGEGFVHICEAIKQLAQMYPDFHFVYPVHLNPNVQEPVKEFLAGLDNVFLLPPLEYVPFIYLMLKSKIVLTDSGGIQEEAPSLGKPVLVMRETTERPEGIEAGTAKLVGTDRDKIVTEVTNLIENPAEYEAMSKAHNPYGDGKASQRIADFLVKNL